MRKFEQSLREGQARYGSEYAVFMGRIKVYFDIESISGLLSTCAPEEKDALWAEMKVLSTDGCVWGGAWLMEGCSCGAGDVIAVADVCAVYCEPCADGAGWTEPVQ